MIVTVHQAKTHLRSSSPQVENGEEVIIAHAAEPVARFSLVARPTPKPRFGSMKGRIALTDAFFEFLAGDDRLPTRARKAIEVVGKHRRGKLPEADALARDSEREIAAQSFAGLAITLAHAELAGRLEIAHRDPSIACSSPHR